MNWVKPQETADPGGQGRNSRSRCSSRLANGWHAGMEGGAARSSLLWKRLCVQILYEISWFLNAGNEFKTPLRAPPTPPHTHKKRHGKTKVIQAKQNTSAGWISIWEDQSKTLERIWAPRCGGWGCIQPSTTGWGLGVRRNSPPKHSWVGTGPSVHLDFYFQAFKFTTNPGNCH